MTTGEAGELAVLLGGRLAATVRRSRAGGYTLAYEAAWRAGPDAFPLSLSMPLVRRVHEGPALGYYLRALLPDSPARLAAIAEQHGVRADDPFALLGSVGEDCPGAVQFVRPERLALLMDEERDEVEWLDDDQVAALVRAVAAEGMAGGAVADTGWFSLPGALPKVALRRDAERERWGKPGGRAASTHIIKPALRGVGNHSENEHLCLELARELGFSAAASRVTRFGDTAALCVERYDRFARDGGVERIHQEDLSQALGANPALRYAAEGAPVIREVAGLLRERSSEGTADLLRFLDAVALNWIIAGTDAHVRNYSVLIHPGGDAALAPLYDVTSALLLKTAVPIPSMRLAMGVAGVTALGEITREVWEAQAGAVGVRPERLIASIRDLAARVPEAARAVADRASCVPEGFADAFARKVGKRARECGAALAG